MLLMFKIKNYASFKDEVILDIRKSTLREHENHVFLVGGYNLLKTIAIYGPNASGKSNLICAISDFKRYILNQLYNEKIENFELSGGNVRLVPFLLAEDEDKKIEFEIVFYNMNKLYQYGFIVDEEKITEEWLYVEDENVFDRQYLNVQFGDSYAEILEDSTKVREDRLYLSILDYYNTDKQVNDMLSAIKDFLANKLNVFSELFFESAIKGRAGIYRIYSELQENKEFRERVVEYVKKIDIGVDDIEVEKVREVNSETGESREVPVIKMIHSVYNNDGENVNTKPFDLRMESSGTNRFLSYIQEILKLMDGGGVFVIDELSARLHPLLTKFIVDLFQSKTNKNNAQLIFTTHEMTILNKDQFRRDEVVLIDKDRHGVSKLTTLSQLKIRKDASFAKDYINGKYGAIPIIDFHLSKEGESIG